MKGRQQIPVRVAAGMVLATLVLAACQAASPAAQTTAAAEQPAAAAAETTAAPTVAKELHASDPAAVQLAAGQVQLVEFFAFW